MVDRVGQQLGNYHLVRLLGQGGFADVYLGEHIHLGTEAAIKVLAMRLASEEVERFRSEARMIARLKHAHIVRVLEFGIDETTPFLVMDYAPNGTLRKLYPRGTRLPLPTIVSYVKQVADALQFAHNSKLIHRDIKPENMLLGDKQEVLLSDFGIAIVAQSSRYDRTQDSTGTIAYMAPEQIQAHPRPASDQYSLGIVVYEWLSGDRPFNGSFTEIAAKHVLMPPPSLREKVPTIPLSVEQAVLTALAKDPKQRFGSVQAFANALEQASQLMTASPADPPSVMTPSNQMRGPNSFGPPASQLYQSMHPGALQPPSGQSVLSTESPRPIEVITPLPSESVISTELIMRAQQMAQPSGMNIAADPGSAAAVGGPPAGQAFPPTSTKPSQRQSAQPLDIITSPSRTETHDVLKRDLSRRTVVVGLAGLVIVGVTGGSLVWLLSSRTPSSPSSLRPTSTSLSRETTLFTYRGHSGPVLAVAWSPDSKHIASASNDETIQVWDAANGEHVFIYHAQSYRGLPYGGVSVVWSPDSKRIADAGNNITGNDPAVQVWDATDGAHVFTYRKYNNWVQAVAWSPNGKRIASASLDGTVQVWDAADGGNVLIYGKQSAGDQSPGPGEYAVAWSPDSKYIASSYLDLYDSAHPVVQVWDATTGNTLLTYRGHSDLVQALTWSPDGKGIASASNDKRCRSGMPVRETPCSRIVAILIR